MLFEFGPHKIHYNVKRTSRRRSVGIQVMPDARVEFRVPRRFSGNLDHIIEKHAGWILKKQNDIKTRLVVEGGPEAAIPAPIAPEAVKRHRLEALQKIKESIGRFQPRVGMCPSKISIRNQKTRWGSCSRRHHLSFNWRLVLLPADILDYVVVHEMCHMIHLNHSRHFWEKVENILPDYLEKRRWLKKQQIGFF